MFSTGDRVSRDTVYQLATLERHGNVTYADKTARVAHVVFDNHSDGMPILCTFESLRLVNAPKSDETPASEEYVTVEHFRALKGAATKSFPDVGDSVAFLYEKDPKNGKGILSVAYGVKYGGQSHATNDYRHSVMTREGERHHVRPEHVACI
ncbi:hypothetical protein SEA_LUCKYSOCKE_206 [Streptomyces phage LuckySocke]|jgi:hypothetical protein|nr:hypothetical protein SEA_ALONE_209 [Streptomyces phage Alone3]WPH58862.1 hypothetical protein SEA_LUCKYSOCKE_206 [Streptomyces phage LuckySocke]